MRTALSKYSPLSNGGKARKPAGLRAWITGAVLSICMLPQIAAARIETDPAATGPLAPGVSYIVINGHSGKILSENAADIKRYPASLTKLMTLDLAFQALADHRLSLSSPVLITADAAYVQPVKLGLRPGEIITVNQAILAMATMSANDAATALGQTLGGGSEERFAEMMTLRARALGMNNTQFRNPSGLPDPAQFTTAHDMAILASDLLRDFPQYSHYFATESFDFNGRTIYSNDAMLKIYPGALGMKTGFTDLARFNLVTAAERNGTLLIGVELHEHSWRTAYQQMTALMDQGFGGPSDGMPLVASLPHLIPDADAATISRAPSEKLAMNRHRGATKWALRRTSPAHATPLRTAQVTQDMVPGWIAQVGTYESPVAAKREAAAVRNMRGLGIARVGSIDLHGKRLWRAQLAGLDARSARSTCSILSHRHVSCFVIAPAADHLAMR